MAHPFRWPLSLAAIWLLLPVVGVLVAATLEPIPPHDYWWHLAMGRLIASGAFPDTNLFLYTLPVDRAFVDQPWLGQWLMYVAYDGLGHAGTVILRNLLLGAAFAFAVGTAWRRCGDARAVGATGLIAAVIAYPVLTVRTRMFAFLPFVTIVWACFGVAEGRLKARWLIVAPVATLFWVNTHGSFILAPVLVAAIGFGSMFQRFVDDRVIDWRKARDWAATLASVLLAGGVSPLGFGAYAYVVQLALQSNVAQSVTEWLPPDVAEPTGQVFVTAVACSLVVLVLRRKHVRIPEVLVFAGTLTLAAGAVRSMFWWAAILPIVVAPHLSALLPDADGESPTVIESRIHAVVVALMLACVILVQPGFGRAAIGELTSSGRARQQGEGAWILNHEHAVAAIEQLQADGRQRVFHDQALGGMLEYALGDEGPRQVAFVDQRMEWVPEEIWSRYFALSAAAPHWDRELDRLGVDTLLLSHDSQGPLIEAAHAHRNWKLTGVDQSHVLLYRISSLDRVQHPAEQQ